METKELRKIEFRKFLKNFRRVMGPFKPYIKPALGLVTLMQVLALVEPLITMYIVNGVITQDAFVRDNLWFIGLAGLLVMSGIGRISALRNRLIRRLWQNIERHMPIWCGQKLMRLPLSFHQSENTGMLIGKILRGVYRSMDLIGIILYEIFPLAVSVVITSSILFWLNWWTVLVFIPVVTIFAIMTYFHKSKYSVMRTERHDLDSKADEALSGAIQNIMTVKAFAQEDREVKTVEVMRQKIYDMIEEEHGAGEQFDMKQRNPLISAGRIGVICVCASAAFSDPAMMGILVAQLVFLNSLSESVFKNCYRIGVIFDRILEAVEPVEKLIALLDAQETIKDPENPIPVPERLSGKIEFDHVTYTYPNRGGEEKTRPEPTLRNISLVAEPGEVIGIAGPSGGGKSSLLWLLLGFGDPDQGRGSVRIDGIDLRLARRCDIRRQIGYVSQDVEIFNDTIAYNIAYGCPGADMDQIVAAAKAADAHDFIMSFPLGYATKVGNQGEHLSGGQRQRLGVARALIIDPAILILDEATSHVDSESEVKMYRSFEKLRGKMTLIIVAHRLSAIESADKIIIVEGGRIKETGTSRDLMNQNGIYRRLVDIQRHAAEVA